MSKLQELARRRETLIIRSGGQRERLAESYERLAHSLRWASMAKSIVQRIKEHPAALIGATSLIGAPGKFRRVGKILSLGWSVFSAISSRRRR